MKKLQLFIYLVVVSFGTFSQSANSNITYKKISRPSLMLELPNTEEETQGTILAKLKENGYNPSTQGSLFWKKNTQDGFYVFKDVNMRALGLRNVDLYFRVEKKKRSPLTSLHLLVSKGEENFIGPDTDLELWLDARTFLDGFTENAVAYSLEQEIKAQETKIKSLQSRRTSLVNDQKDLEARIARYQRELENNQKKQVETETEIENQTRILEEIREKRKQ